MCVCLTDNDVLKLRESCQHLPPVEKALAILAAAYSEMSREQLTALSIGERDARLLAVREKTFGKVLDVFTRCPVCQQDLELRLTTANLLFPSPQAAPEEGLAFSTTIDSMMVRYRLPDSADLQALSSCKSTEQAKQLLLDRCILSLQNCNGKELLPDKAQQEIFSPDFVSALAKDMTEQDPQAEVLLNLKCVECGHQWQSLFDIVTFFWAELEIHAKRLLSEIYTLARLYHWSERDILALSPTRRRWYLEMASI